MSTVGAMPTPHAAPAAPGGASLVAAYLGLGLLCWALFAMAGTDWQRGPLRFWDGLYEATWSLGPPMLIGLLALPWARRLQARPAGLAATLARHVLGAGVFVLLWLALEYALTAAFFGSEHALATTEQRWLWRSVWGVIVYLALMAGFGGALQARRAQAEALKAARAEAALVRAELAAITGKLNPHFLFNTLNTLLLLTRKDPGAAEDALLRFGRMMRHVLDTPRDAGDRVPLRDELAFVRDYLALESLRLGPRLQVDWQIDPATEDAEVPPLSLQPLVENAVGHGIAPRVEGGRLLVQAQRAGGELCLRVRDDGVGCTWPLPPAVPGSSPRRGGIGLSALRRRFELDYDGQARMHVRSAPGQGFEVSIHIPLNAA
jgi:signal transduction histidine kinase